MTAIVILRGNSGSGKTTVAKMIREAFSGTTMIVSQDTVRREILNVKDRLNNLSIDLMLNMVEYGLGHYDLIVLEGILNSKKYETMLHKVNQLETEVYFYYFQISFEETFERHLTKSDVDFGKTEMEQWWVENDVLHYDNEYLLNETMTADDCVSEILNRLNLV